MRVLSWWETARQLPRPKGPVSAQTHTQGSHHAAVGTPRMDCSRNQCHSDLNDGPGGAERERENEEGRDV